MLGYHTVSVLKQAEEAAQNDCGKALSILRGLSLDEFGTLLLDVPHEYPNLKNSLPRMAAEKVQRDWTGNVGQHLLIRSCHFVRTVESAFRKHLGRGLEDATVLDYGVGWGRLVRLMYRYTAPEKIYGVDSWSESIRHCREAGLLGNLALCDDVPRSLPFDGVSFDLVYACSVFTHLSEKTAMQVLDVMRSCIRPDGLLVISIRPCEHWHAVPPSGTGPSNEEMVRRHTETGFAFIPHNRAPIDGDITYGDASISLDYMQKKWTAWEYLGYEQSLIDPNQLIVFLKPRIEE